MAWRTPFTILAFVSIFFSIATYFWLAESPRWLALRGRAEDAFRAWEYLEVKGKDRDEVIVQDTGDGGDVVFHPPASAGTILAPDALTQVVSRRSEPAKAAKENFFEIFGRDVRSRTMLGVFLMGMQQLAGIDGVLYVRNTPRSPFPPSSSAGS